jgi:glycerophosphoryl diester phosphodiesterase
VVAAAALFIANTSRRVNQVGQVPSPLAHKGLGQNFDLANIKSDDCTAIRMLSPRHSASRPVLGHQRGDHGHAGEREV